MGVTNRKIYKEEKAVYFMKKKNGFLVKWVKCRGLEVILHSPRGKNGQGIGRKPPTVQYGFLAKEKAVDALIKVDKSNGRIFVGCPYLQEIKRENRSLRGVCKVDKRYQPTCLYLKNRFYKMGSY